MPGSVQNATPLTVLQESLSRAFVHDREYPVLDNEYRNGESQRKAQASNSRKRWRLLKRLTPAQLQTLRDFSNSRKGPTEPFFFYDPYETSPKFSHDPSGQAAAGRYTVRFAADWSQSVEFVRTEVSIEILELG